MSRCIRFKNRVFWKFDQKHDFQVLWNRVCIRIVAEIQFPSRNILRNIKHLSLDLSLMKQLVKNSFWNTTSEETYNVMSQNLLGDVKKKKKRRLIK